MVGIYLTYLYCFFNNRHETGTEAGTDILTVAGDSMNSGCNQSLGDRETITQMSMLSEQNVRIF